MKHLSRILKMEVAEGLPENEVHLWRVDLGDFLVREPSFENSLQDILSADEKARASRFHFPRHRQFFAATRAMLRTILGNYVGSEPGSLVFDYGEKGKPRLRQNSSGKRIEFNVSHSGEVALLAFAQKRILGVDVEQIRDERDHEGIARRFFSEYEQEQLARLKPEERQHAFFRCWSRKEAFIKARGEGLSLPLRHFDVSVSPGDENALLATRPDPQEANRWWLREVSAGSGYEGALCVEGRGWNLRLVVF